MLIARVNTVTAKVAVVDGPYPCTNPLERTPLPLTVLTLTLVLRILAIKIGSKAETKSQLTKFITFQKISIPLRKPYVLVQSLSLLRLVVLSCNIVVVL